jgi:hypothetical protein
MILTNVCESTKRECFPLPRGLVVGHCSVGDAGRDTRKVSFLHNVYIKKIAAKFQINDNSHIAFTFIFTIFLSKFLGIALKSDIKRY